MYCTKKKDPNYSYLLIQTAEKIVYKKSKELHPASQRVAEAAEYLMCVLFEHKVSRLIYLLRIISSPVQTTDQISNLSQSSTIGACFHGEYAGDLLNEEVLNIAAVVFYFNFS